MQRGENFLHGGAQSGGGICIPKCTRLRRGVHSRAASLFARSPTDKSFRANFRFNKLLGLPHVQRLKRVLFLSTISFLFFSFLFPRKPSCHAVFVLIIIFRFIFFLFLVVFHHRRKDFISIRFRKIRN